MNPAKILEKMRKGQAGIMEYILLTFFIMVIVVILIIFVSGWQISQLEMGQAQDKTRKILTLTQNVLNSQMFVKGSGMFDDSKLHALSDLENPNNPDLDICTDLEQAFGMNWYLEVHTLGCDRDCIGPTGYGVCCSWTICKPPDLETGEYQVDILSLPVNVYRKTGFDLGDSTLPRVDVGLAKVGVYSAIE